MYNSTNTAKKKLKEIYCRYIPKNVQNEWRQLFTKQLYCIGKDIVNPNNLLLQYGFTRQRPPNPDLGSSQYSLETPIYRIILWGFGMIFATKNTGLFLWRHEFEPKLLCMDALLSNLWDPDQLPSCTAPKTTQEFSLMLQLLIQSIKWFEQYESWVLDTCGQCYIFRLQQFLAWLQSVFTRCTKKSTKSIWLLLDMRHLLQ
jgi:hypothetical protein